MTKFMGQSWPYLLKSIVLTIPQHEINATENGTKWFLFVKIEIFGFLLSINHLCSVKNIGVDVKICSAFIKTISLPKRSQITAFHVII